MKEEGGSMPMPTPTHAANSDREDDQFSSRLMVVKIMEAHFCQCHYNVKLSWSNDLVSQTNDLVPQNNDLVSQNNEKLSQNHDLISQNNEKLSQNHDLVSQTNDKLSKGLSNSKTFTCYYFKFLVILYKILSYYFEKASHFNHLQYLFFPSHWRTWASAQNKLNTLNISLDHCGPWPTSPQLQLKPQERKKYIKEHLCKCWHFIIAM